MSANLSVFLNFNGNCADVLAFYADVFKAETGRVMKYSDAPGSDSADDRIMYSEMVIGGLNVMFCDTSPDNFVLGNNFTMTHMDSNLEETRRVFDALAEGGKINMELEKTFFSELYGMVTDKFGINWNIMA